VPTRKVGRTSARLLMRSSAMRMPRSALACSGSPCAMVCLAGRLRLAARLCRALWACLRARQNRAELAPDLKTSLERTGPAARSSPARPEIGPANCQQCRTAPPPTPVAHDDPRSGRTD